MEFSTIDEILDFAISNEERAEALYRQLADRVRRPGMREAFLHFADQEKGHKARLLKVKTGELPVASDQQVRDLKIVEFLVEPKPADNMTYAEALLFAMKAEKAAYALYLRLAELTEDGSLKRVFSNLAQEEAEHKLRFELEYDDVVLEGV